MCLPLLVLRLAAAWFILVASVYLGALAGVVATAVACLWALVEFATAAYGGFDPRAPADHLRVAPPPAAPVGVPAGRPARDPGYRSYYSGPVLRDLRAVLQRATTKTVTQIFGRSGGGAPADGSAGSVPLVRRVTDLWGRVGHWALRLLIAVPIGAAVAGLVLGAVAAGALVTSTSLIFVTLLAAAVLVCLVTGFMAGLLERAALFARGITIECGRCHERATRPVYRCGNPACSAEHRMLVPGRFGVLWRTCRCQQRLPTLLMLGKYRLPAQCANCGLALPLKGLTAPTFHVPVIAGPRAGKSVYMHVAIHRLMLLDKETGSGFEFADPTAREAFQKNTELGIVDDPRNALKTRTLLPAAYNVYVGRKKSMQRRLLYLYDPQGELLEGADDLAEATFLRFTKGVLLVIDPFSLAAVRSAVDRRTLDDAGASTSNAKLVLERFAESMRERVGTRGGPQLAVPVAVVLTKADALRGARDVTHPYRGLGPAATDPSARAERDKAIRAWLDRVGGRGDLVKSVRNNFRAAAYFTVSYEDARQVRPHADAGNVKITNDDPAEPLRWLMNGGK
jgi:hypothetical protein